LSTGFRLYIESGKKALRHLGDYRDVAERVKSLVKAYWGDAEVYVFGSAVEGRYTAASDIDILIVVDGVSRDEADRVKASIYECIDAPIELHIASRDEFENWYRRFIDVLEEV